MSDQLDRAALVALSDALADAASVHRSATDVADGAMLKQTLAARAVKLERLSKEVRTGAATDEPGSLLRLLDQMKLNADQWFGDDDAAADTAGRDAEAAVADLIDDHLRGGELSPSARSAFEDVRGRLANGGVVKPAGGLKTLPT